MDVVETGIKWTNPVAEWTYRALADQLAAVHAEPAPRRTSPEAISAHKAKIEAMAKPIRDRMVDLYSMYTVPWMKVRK